MLVQAVWRDDTARTIAVFGSDSAVACSSRTSGSAVDLKRRRGKKKSGSGASRKPLGPKCHRLGATRQANGWRRANPPRGGISFSPHPSGAPTVLLPPWYGSSCTKRNGRSPPPAEAPLPPPAPLPVPRRDAAIAARAAADLGGSCWRSAAATAAQRRRQSRISACGYREVVRFVVFSNRAARRAQEIGECRSETNRAIS